MFHFTKLTNFSNIIKTGLKANVCGKSYDSGPGVYLYDDLECTVDIGDYLSPNRYAELDKYIVVEVSIPDPNRLLMDEDAMGLFGEEKLFDTIETEFPRDVVLFYYTKLVETRDPQQSKIKTIDQFKIKASPHYKTPIARSSILTARYDGDIGLQNVIRIYAQDTKTSTYPVLFENGAINKKELDDFVRYG